MDVDKIIKEMEGQLLRNNRGAIPYYDSPRGFHNQGIAKSIQILRNHENDPASDILYELLKIRAEKIYLRTGRGSVPGPGTPRGEFNRGIEALLNEAKEILTIYKTNPQVLRRNEGIAVEGEFRGEVQKSAETIGCSEGQC